MRRISPKREREIRRLAAQGNGLRDIARFVRCSRHAVANSLVRAQVREAKPKPRAWDPSPARLSLAEREEVRVGLQARETFTAIAARIGRAVSTVSREVAVNGGRKDYRA